jgi:hypothetical protein
MPRRKIKPTFEIPVGTEQPDAPVGWVYRAEAPEISRCSNNSPLRAAGMGLLLVSAGTIGLVSLAAMGLIAAPISLVRGRKRG